MYFSGYLALRRSHLWIKNHQRVLLGAHWNSTSRNSKVTDQPTYPALGNPIFLRVDKPTIKIFNLWEMTLTED